MSDFEAERQRKIAQNHLRLSEIGLNEASKRLHKAAREARAPAKRCLSAPRVRVVPKELRRSSRSEGKPAPVYNDALVDAADRAEKGSRRRRTFDTIVVGAAEEKYTQEHLAMLGDCKEPWELFVDGYDAAGNRVYDKVNGQTCHQCRQKTMGKRTSCSECQSLTGVFCGDCLYMRYGENVDEASANPDWKCPHCRDPLLCNCSQHRTRRGWAPTGTLYRKATAFGYKSVAHYLVLNHLEGSEGAPAGAPPSPSVAVADIPAPADAAPAPATPPREEDAGAQPTPPLSSKAQQPAARKQRCIDASFQQRKAAPVGRKGKFVGRKTNAAMGPKAGGVAKKPSSFMAGASKRVRALLGLTPVESTLHRTRGCRV